jgi:ribosome assembly protein YihI (activator of Der GTPase)
MFGKKNALLLEEAEAKIRRLQDKIDWHERHQDKEQLYIEELCDVIADLSRQLGMVLNSDNMERLKNHPNLQDNSNFFFDLNQLFRTRSQQGKNVTCYYGKELDELQRKFQDRDFKNSKIVHLTERLTLDNLHTLIREGLWNKSLEESLMAIRRERKLDTIR